MHGVILFCLSNANCWMHRAKKVSTKSSVLFEKKTKNWFWLYIFDYLLHHMYFQVGQCIPKCDNFFSHIRRRSSTCRLQYGVLIRCSFLPYICSTFPWICVRCKNGLIIIILHLSIMFNLISDIIPDLISDIIFNLIAN